MYTNNFKLHLSLFARDRIMWVFILIALSVRVAFWLYTGRIWEDALITLTGVENALEGFGLTHHISEPRVHYFTSPLSVLIPLVFSPFVDGLFALRFVSLLAAAGSIIMAYRICKEFELRNVAVCFVLSFLSFDFLHIYFAMTGMETQVSVFFLLSSMWSFLKIYKTCGGIYSYLLGINLGFCMLCRPDFAMPCAVIGAWLLFTDRRKQLLKVIPAALAVYLPWIIFTFSYYGSPIPNTVLAKSGGFSRIVVHVINALFGGGGSSVIISAKQENSVIIEHIIKALQNNWKAYLPVYEFCDWISIKNAVLKYAVLLLTGVVSISLFFMGIYDAVFNKKRRKILIFAIIFLAFAFYKFVCIRHNYFMWYIPPFTALAIIVSGTAINNLLQTKFKFLSFAFAAFLIFMWVFPLPFLFGVEKQAQIYIENGVRKKVGERLNSIMGKDAVVGLEPLGYIGYYARNKTTFDNPGLSSKIVVEMLKQNGNPPWSFALSYICRFLKPDFMVLRPDELDRIKVQLKTFDGDYQFMETIESQYNEFVCGPLLLSRAQDATFYIFKRNPDAQ